MLKSQLMDLHFANKTTFYCREKRLVNLCGPPIHTPDLTHARNLNREIEKHIEGWDCEIRNQ